MGNPVRERHRQRESLALGGRAARHALRESGTDYARAPRADVSHEHGVTLAGRPPNKFSTMRWTLQAALG